MKVKNSVTVEMKQKLFFLSVGWLQLISLYANGP